MEIYKFTPEGDSQARPRRPFPWDWDSARMTSPSFAP